MRCTKPKTVGYQADGIHLSFSPKDYNKELATFQLPCGKCLACRLNYGRQWAIRCVHETRTHRESSFLTLTYDESHLTSQKLQYAEFQLFMKRLRKRLDDSDIPHQIGYIVCGEYGPKKKRPHWHACLFGWSPWTYPKDANYTDPKEDSKNEHGDQTWTSDFLTDIWGKGKCNFGQVTLKSAGYVARYSAKKLAHGHDQSHDYHPIFKTSSKHAIGKRWLEKYHDDIFSYGKVVMDGKNIGAIPRYYERWLKKYEPLKWERYVTQTKCKNIDQLRRQSERELDWYGPIHNAKNEIEHKILKQKFEEKLQRNLKL